MSIRLLLIQASPRGELSVSRHLARSFVRAWKTAHPDGEVTERDLTTSELPYVTGSWIAASFTPEMQQSTDMKAELSLSNRLVAELFAADEIVISTPNHNYNIPANLKSYFDLIVRRGLTFASSGEGLLRGKRCTVLMASGGLYGEGSPLQGRDIATAYLRVILPAIGIDDLHMVAAEGVKAVGMGEISLGDFLALQEPKVVEAAIR
ncbi:FMN-dependent NADH-azoreductase [Frateuria aurantia]